MEDKQTPFRQGRHKPYSQEWSLVPWGHCSRPNLGTLVAFSLACLSFCLFYSPVIYQKVQVWH